MRLFPSPVCQGVPPVGGGGGHSGTEWLLTAKLLRRAEAVKFKIWGRSTLLKAKKGHGQLQTENLIRHL